MVKLRGVARLLPIQLSARERQPGSRSPHYVATLDRGEDANLVERVFPADTARRRMKEKEESRRRVYIYIYTHKCIRAVGTAKTQIAIAFNLPLARREAANVDLFHGVYVAVSDTLHFHDGSVRALAQLREHLEVLECGWRHIDVI